MATGDAAVMNVEGGYTYRRHALALRVMHWINVVALTILLMSGLGIFNAHPALYWGLSSYQGKPPVLAMTAVATPDGDRRGVTRILGHTFDTDGLFGVSKQPNGQRAIRGFPWWMTIPDLQWLSMSRAWHFFFAWVLVLNGLAYVGWAIASRHLARDLAPTRTDWAGIGRSIVDHLRLRHPEGEAAKRYNVLQKLAYLTVIFVLLPLTILMGLAMSPRIDTVFAGWVDLVGGRQSARTIHFVCAWLIVAFVAIHVFEVIVTGLWNNLNSMITGRFRVRTTPAAPRAAVAEGAAHDAP
jgi:thiosulfate reductase cytochrome b subunit